MSTTASTTAAPAVDVRHVTRRFGKTTALDDVTLSFPANTVCGLLGRNGAGTTTLMSLIAGHDRPDAGEVLVGGGQPFENPAVLANLCFIRDNQRYPDEYQLGHILRVLPAFYDAWDEDLAQRIVTELRIPMKTKLRKLSRGQQSAVAIVIGLASRAPLTIFDEPYLGLDATARRVFYDLLIADLADYPRTVLVSTHLIDEMEPLLERAAILDQGRVVLDTDVDDARTRAVTVSGTASAVARAIHGHRVLTSHVMGGLRSVMIETRPDDETLGNHPGVEVSPVGLQDLVAAYGELDRALDAPALEGASR
jgi:ABC-2 type transport system ATP-binding protein